MKQRKQRKSTATTQPCVIITLLSFLSWIIGFEVMTGTMYLKKNKVKKRDKNAIELFHFSNSHISLVLSMCVYAYKMTRLVVSLFSLFSVKTRIIFFCKQSTHLTLFNLTYEKNHVNSVTQVSFCFMWQKNILGGLWIARQVELICLQDGNSQGNVNGSPSPINSPQDWLRSQQR